MFYKVHYYASLLLYKFFFIMLFCCGFNIYYSLVLLAFLNSTMLGSCVFIKIFELFYRKLLRSLTLLILQSLVSLGGESW